MLCTMWIKIMTREEIEKMIEDSNIPKGLKIQHLWDLECEYVINENTYQYYKRLCDTNYDLANKVIRILKKYFVCCKKFDFDYYGEFETDKINLLFRCSEEEIKKFSQNMREEFSFINLFDKNVPVKVSYFNGKEIVEFGEV